MRYTDIGQSSRAKNALEALALGEGDLRRRFESAYTFQWGTVHPDSVRRVDDRKRYWDLQAKLHGDSESGLRGALGRMNDDDVKAISKELFEICIHSVVDNSMSPLDDDPVGIDLDSKVKLVQKLSQDPEIRRLMETIQAKVGG